MPSWAGLPDMASALALSDLVVRGDGPRVEDARLAEVLGLTQRHAIRQLIRRHEVELKTHGEFCISLCENPQPRPGRPSKICWLNEAQALLICMFARTAKAAEVRHQVITVFLAWRRGELAGPAAPALPPPPDPFAVAHARIDLAAAASVFQRDHLPEPFALSVATSPVWRQGRRPNFWPDLPVRTLLTGAHRQMPIATALEICRREFGEARTPSRSGLHRYWMVLDRVRGGRA